MDRNGVKPITSVWAANSQKATVGSRIRSSFAIPILVVVINKRWLSQASIPIFPSNDSSFLAMTNPRSVRICVLKSVACNFVI